MRASVLLLLGIVLALGLGVCKAGTRGKGRRQQKRAKPKTRAAKKVATQRAGTPFVLQLVRSDNWLCFAGDGMRRCGANTVWHQVQITSNSAATNLQLHSTPPGEAPVCLVRKSCDEANSPLDASTLTLGSCNQSCSSMAWGIENDDFSQSVIVFNNTQHCAAYNVVNNTFHLDACIDAKYAPFLMQKFPKNIMATFNTSVHLAIDAALNNDKALVVELFDTKKIADVNARNWQDATILHAAASKGNKELVEYLIRTQQADVNLHDRLHRSALMEASSKGQKEVVELLLAAGAEADATQADGMSSLMMAANGGFASIVELLLDQPSVDVGRQDVNGFEALHWACTNFSTGSLDTVKLLLQAGANVNATTKTTTATPLAMAADATNENDTSILELLLKSQADVNVPMETTPLMRAAFDNKKKVAALLLAANSNVNEVSQSSNVTALMFAAAVGATDIVKMLLDHGANVHLKHFPANGDALFEAAINGSTPVVELLLASSADLMTRDEDNLTCLHAAAEYGNVEVSEMFIDKGIPIDTIAGPGSTPLMHAVSTNRSEVVEMLLRRGANPNIVTNASSAYLEKMLLDGTKDPYEHQMSALMFASRLNLLPIVKMLVESGAGVDVNLVDAQNKTALSHAASNNSLNVVNYLVQAGADPNTVLFGNAETGDQSILLYAVVNNHTSLALELLKRGADGSYADEDGVTIATHAAFLGNHQVVEQLLATNSDVSSGNAEGTDPLIAASAEGHLEIVSALLQSKRVDSKARDIDGTTALMAASVRGHKQVATLLINAGANVNEQNIEGHTALMFAFNGKHQVETLLEKYQEFVKAGEDNNTRLLREALAVHGSLIQLLRRSGADLTLTDKYGHRAADFDSFKVSAAEGGAAAADTEL